MKKEAKKIFKFKGENYSIYELIGFYIDERQKEYKEGEVNNLSTGEYFDISEITNHSKELNEFIMDNSEHLSYYDKSKIRKILSADECEKIKRELNIKLDNDMITLDELKELMFMEGDNFGEGYVKISLINKNYIKLNQKSIFPDEIRDTTLGKYLKLLLLTTYKNNIQKTNRANSGNMNKKDLMKYLKIANEKTFTSVFMELEKYDLLYRKFKTGKGFSIFINPFYANRNSEFILDKTQYQLFKEDLVNKLPKRIATYLEKIAEMDDMVINIDEDD